MGIRYLALITLALPLVCISAAAPFVVTMPATAVGTNQATLNGFVDPQGTPTTVWFEFGLTTAYGTATPEQNADFVPQNFSHVLSGLSNGVTYHYRAVALSQGIFFGADQTFTPGPAFANVAWYRLGENDPGAANGAPVTGTTADIIGTNHLKQYGGPIYTGAVSADLSNRIGSLLGVQFNGTSQYVSNAVASTATNNFGIEAWVKPNNVNAGVRVIAGNGNTAANGWAIFQNGAAYLASLGGVVTIGDGAALAVAGTWAHVALVRDNGTSTLYVNGVAAGTTTSAPISPAGGFTLATRAQQPTSEFFNGAIDEVRVFRFQPGQFNTNQLLFHVQRVVTLAATDVAGTNATLNGSANPLGLPTRVWFEWGPSTSFGNVTSARTLGGGFGNTNLSEALAGLSGGAPYYFRAVASNAAGIVRGTTQSFILPNFIRTAIDLPGIVYGSVAWGDYDNDGRLDLLMTGMTNWQTGGRSGWIWRNTGAGFSNINAALPGLSGGSLAWGDHDNDNLLDFGVCGFDHFQLSSGVWRNTGAGFSNIYNRLPRVQLGSLTWGDYDNDGKLDLLFYGTTNATSILEIWRNTGNEFTNIHAGFPEMDWGSGAWGDYDNDGWLDILLTGLYAGVQPITQIWRNTRNGFTNINAALTGVWFGSAGWTDYDNDGRSDILLCGASAQSNGFPTAFVTEVWRNTGSGFSNINAGLPGIVLGSGSWGDYDNDGRLDVLLNGATNFVSVASNNLSVSQVWRNSGAGFSNINVGLPGVTYGAGTWADYDNDGRLDFVLYGTTNGIPQGGYITLVCKNITAVTNTPPAAPTGLAAAAVGDIVTLSWNATTDNQTSANGLRYNLRIGTTPGGSDVLAPMSAANGWRRLPQMGEKRLRAPFKYVMGTPYYWSVQAVDTAFGGSAFAPEQSFKPQQWDAPVLLTSPNVPRVPVGDYNGNGVIDQNELNNVLSNFWPSSPWLQMTNLADLGGSNVTFTLSNSTAGAFSVEYSTNLIDWSFLGPAIPRYLFTDTNAPAEPRRYYRLRWP
jgi:hypothetical protein